MKHLDLFSGIGGFALAADRVWENVEHIFCDNDQFCQAILKKHWPKAEIYGDIRTLAYTDDQRKLQPEGGKQKERGRTSDGIDLLTGGFPCQPFSQAGRRKGTADDRYLWPEMFRVIREFKPEWVIGENVAGFITWNDGMVLRQVYADLEGEGYEIQAFVIPAVAVNAPHRRDRVWIVAHNNEWQSGSRNVAKSIQKTFVERGANNSDASNAGREYRKSGSSKSVERKTSERSATAEKIKRFERNGWSENWLEVATRLCRVDDGLSRRLDRNPRLKALGNAIVPQVAEEIMKAIKKTESISFNAKDKEES